MFRHQALPPPALSPPSSFFDYVAIQPGHIQRLLRDCDLSEVGTSTLVDAIYSTETLFGGTDGGLKNSLGTFGFLWGAPALDTLILSGKGRVPGSSFIMSPTRTELCGIFAALTYLRLVIEFYHVVLPKKVSCCIYSDSKSALTQVQDRYSYEGFGTTWRCRTHYDLEAAIRQCLKQLPFPFSWEWVRGHAGRRKEPHEFSFPETLNEAADNLATNARTCRELDHDDDHWPEQEVSVIGHRGRMCGRIACELRFCCTAGDLISYWQERYKWNASLVNLVDHLGTKKALSKLPPNSLQRVQKLRCGWLPVNRRVSREDPDRFSSCSACSAGDLVEETVDHVFQCSCAARRSAILQRFSDMSANFLKWNTSKYLIRALHTGALAWIEQREPPPVESLHSPETHLGALISRAYNEQTSLGWNVLFRGFWSISWRQAQELEFANSSSTRGFQDTVKIGQVEHSCGCSICSI